MRIAIINSTGFWPLGWAITPQTQQPVLDSLRRGGCDVDVYEVDSKQSLLQVIEQIKQYPNSLVWANAYNVKVNADGDESFWLADTLREHQLPFIGSDGQTLHHVLHKHQCQAILAQAGVPIPSFVAVNAEQLNDIADRVMAQGLIYPLFVKPDSLSSSVGISQDCIVHDLPSLVVRVKQMGADYGYPVMVEEFLPGNDITVAVFDSGEQQLLLPTYYTADNHQGAESALDRTDRLQDWGGSKQMKMVTEAHILEQIPEVILSACKAVGILDVTRIDCRLDRFGQLKVFDINGLPGLEFPDSVTVWQMITKLSQQTEVEAFDTLIYLVVYCAAKRHHLPLPTLIHKKAQAYIRDN